MPTARVDLTLPDSIIVTFLEREIFNSIDILYNDKFYKWPVVWGNIKNPTFSKTESSSSIIVVQNITIMKLENENQNVRSR